jgi:peptidoglycan/xylan/chitin deacetylase (PgdA/CDA1 family)
MSYRERFVQSLLSVPGVSALLSPLIRGQAVVFMLHRIRDRERGTDGQDPEGLRDVLTYLRRRRVQLLPLDELVGRLEGDGPRPEPAIAFTMDDGYVDQATLGASLFAEFDCPVTVFVTTGFLDGHLWLWWDKIEYIFGTTHRRKLSVSLGGSTIDYSLDTEAVCSRAQYDFTERCKNVGDVEKQTAIAELAELAEVELPERAPPEYAPMSWSQLRACEKHGVSFAPHTVTHPILAKIPPAQSRREIAESWERLRSESAQPVPIFAYPNGRPQDFGLREVETLSELQFSAAVTSTSGYNSPARLCMSPDARYTLSRFGGADRLAYVTRVVTGLERVRGKF